MDHATDSIFPWAKLKPPSEASLLEQVEKTNSVKGLFEIGGKTDSQKVQKAVLAKITQLFR